MLKAILVPKGKPPSVVSYFHPEDQPDHGVREAAAHQAAASQVEEVHQEEVALREAGKELSAQSNNEGTRERWRESKRVRKHKPLKLVF